MGERILARTTQRTNSTLSRAFICQSRSVGEHERISPPTWSRPVRRSRVGERAAFILLLVLVLVWAAIRQSTAMQHSSTVSLASAYLATTTAGDRSWRSIAAGRQPRMLQSTPLGTPAGVAAAWFRFFHPTSRRGWGSATRRHPQSASCDDLAGDVGAPFLRLKPPDWPRSARPSGHIAA